MEEVLLREISDKYLVPFFSGARLEDKALKSSSQEATVAFYSPVSIAFKVNKDDDYRLLLTRSQSFAKTAGATVPEIAVVRAFIEVVATMSDALASPLKNDLLSTFSRRIVAKAMGSVDDWESTILSGIDELARWSNRQYEGKPISAALGFRHLPQDDKAPHISEICSNDFGAVVSNGHDTLLEFDFSGRFISHASLSSDHDPATYCPLIPFPHQSDLVM